MRKKILYIWFTFTIIATITTFFVTKPSQKEIEADKTNGPSRLPGVGGRVDTYQYAMAIACFGFCIIPFCLYLDYLPKEDEKK